MAVIELNLLAAAAFLANSYVERGELLKAYQQDEDLVRRRPDSFQAHFSRSYVLRYAGLLKVSASECDISLSLAPSDVPRSCAIVFSLQGDYERAMQFIRLVAVRFCQCHVDRDAFATGQTGRGPENRIAAHSAMGKL